MNDITFIIPNRGGNNVHYIINNFEKTFGGFFDTIKFIIIEQSDNLPFKRGQLYNTAMNFVDTEWVGLIDNDIINIDTFNPIQIYQNFGNKPYIAFDKIAQVTLEDSGYTITKTELRTSGFGAFNFMKTDDFKKVNGFSNLCIGWGTEDNILNAKIGFKRYIHTLGHITHKRRNCDTPDLLAFNKSILKKYQLKQIDPQLDGLKQTTYKVISNERFGNIRRLSVNNIGVIEDYKYIDLFNKNKDIEKKYLTPIIPTMEGLSICITAYKATKYIKECVDSVLSQTWFKKHDNWEVLIGIDGCHETYDCVKQFINTYDYALKKNIRVLMMDGNKGTYITSNTLMSIAKYDKLMRFDSDDVMPADLIEKTLPIIGINDILRLKYESFGNKKGIGISNGAIIIKKEIFSKYGGYQPWIVAADFELLERLKERVKIGTSKAHYLRRLHGSDSLQFSEETGMGSELRLKCHEYIKKESKTHPLIDCKTNTFTEYMLDMESDRIIISMTSWKKRVTNIPTVLDSIFTQTKQPDKIVINLSSEEFPEKEKELPTELLEYLKSHNIVEINWVDGPNTRQWKKFIPTLQKYPNDWIICIDDDMKYHPELIEKLWEKHLKSPNNPITTNRGYKVNGYLQHCGCGTLERSEFYGNFNWDDIEEIRKNTGSSDTVYNFLLHKNSHPLVSVECPVIPTPFNAVEPLSKTQKTSSSAEHKKIWAWLENKYGKIGEDKKPVVETPKTEPVKTEGQTPKAEEIKKAEPVKKVEEKITKKVVEPAKPIQEMKKPEPVTEIKKPEEQPIKIEASKPKETVQTQVVMPKKVEQINAQEPKPKEKPRKRLSIAERMKLESMKVEEIKKAEPVKQQEPVKVVEPKKEEVSKSIQEPKNSEPEKKIEPQKVMEIRKPESDKKVEVPKIQESIKVERPKQNIESKTPDVTQESKKAEPIKDVQKQNKKIQKPAPKKRNLSLMDEMIIQAMYH